MSEKMAKLLSVKDVAVALGLSEQRVKQFIYDGRLPAEKVGNQWIIFKSDLDSVEDRQTGRPPKDSNDNKSNND